jgi:hypothetical protein
LIDLAIRNPDVFRNVLPEVCKAFSEKYIINPEATQDLIEKISILVTNLSDGDRSE